MGGDRYCNPTGAHASGDEEGVFGGDWNVFRYAWIATAVCVLLSTILTAKLIYMHLVSFHRPRQQKHVVRILLMVPIYSIDSWLSFRYYWLSVYFDLIRDCYEAIVIYEFYCLLVEYCGGYMRMKEAFEHRENVKLVAPLCCWNVSPKRGMLRWLSRLTLQYVLIRPLMAFIAIPLQAKGKFCPGEITAVNAGYPWITLIGLISVTVAMYALVLFYVVAKEELKVYNPVPKFLSIKFIIMMSFWQSILVAGLVRVKVIHDTSDWTTENIAIGVQNTLICFEMLIVAIWHLFAFDHNEFATQGPKRTEVWNSLVISFNLVDMIMDTYTSFFTRKKREEVPDSDLNVKDAQIEISEEPVARVSSPKSPRAPRPLSTSQAVPPFASAIVIS